MVDITELEVTTFNLYPNPATETVQIELKQQEEVEILVTDVLGRTVYNEILRSAQNDKMDLDVSGWPNGVYLVSIINQNGIRSTQRLVVQH
jgi:mannose/fructose-specific phosphotransferase system component IIA